MEITYTLDDIDRMPETINIAQKWPNNFNSDSQIKMIERLKYLLNMSDELNLQTESQKRMIIQDRLTISSMEKKRNKKTLD
jgi:hypothetical protein